MGSRIVVSLVLVVGLAACNKSPAIMAPAPIPASIAIVGSVASLNLNQTLRLQAVVTFSDRTTRDVTTACMWVSALPGVAQIADGIVTSKSTGSTRISAVYNGLETSFILEVVR